MISEHGRGQEAPRVGQWRLPRWRWMLGEWPAIRQVFHALCVMSDDEDPTDLLEFAARQQWMADLARRFEIVVARFDGTTAIEPEDNGLLETLWQLYAATRCCSPFSPAQPMTLSANLTRPLAARSLPSGLSR